MPPISLLFLQDNTIVTLLHLEYIFCLFFNQVVKLAFVFVNELLYIVFGALGVVFGQDALFIFFVSLLIGVVSDISQRHLCRFPLLFCLQRKFLSSLLVERWNHDAQGFPLSRRG